jgi:hypothetical protein
MRRLVLGLIVSLAACGAPPAAIDGASKEAAEQSIAALTANLPPEKQAEFQAAIAMGWPLSVIAGKTPDEVIALARAKKIAELKEARIPTLQAAIPSAEAAVESAKGNEQTAKKFLSGLPLYSPEFVWREGADGAPAPLFTFNLKNETSEAIQTIVFGLKIAAGPGAKPWINQRFTFKFVEAVTTGETKFVFVTPDLTLPGNADALESRLKPAGGYDIQIDFIRVEDLNGRVIMDDEGVAKAEADLLAAKDALAAAEAELKRLEAGGSIAA